MKRTFKYAGLLAVLPLLAVAMAFESATNASAANERIVCGDMLCSEYPGGRDAFDEAMKQMSALPDMRPMFEEVEMHDDMQMHDDEIDKYCDMLRHGDKYDKMEKHDKMDKDAKMDKHDKMDKHAKMDKHDKMEKHAKMEKYCDMKRLDDKMKGHDDKMKGHDDKMKGHMDDGDLDSVLRLARANVPATIPLHMGYYEGEHVYYIITDASDETHAQVITEQQGWKVEQAPLLEHAPDSALSTTYFFTNGILGDGVHNYQGQVFTSIPGQDEYSALTSHVHVTWIEQDAARELVSEAEILEAAANGQVVLTDLPVVLNMPHIVWPGGQMTVVDKVLKDDTPYGGGQVLDIDLENMDVTFIAHRGWGPDGRTIYYIVTDATPSGPADMMGVISAPSSAGLIANAAAVDLFQFKNGIGGSGPLGFQPGIAVGAPGDANYSPMWRIFVIGWENPDDAAVLETIGDINAYKEAGMINIGIARPMDSDHIVNCPFIDPFQ